MVFPFALVSTKLEMTDTNAHIQIEGRSFGGYKFSEDLMDDDRFDQAKFYRWLSTKNKEFRNAQKAKKK